MTLMNRSQLISKVTKWANKEGHSLKRMVLTHGGATVLQGLRHSTNDVDIDVDQAIWAGYLARGFVPYPIHDGTVVMTVEDGISIRFGWSPPISKDKVDLMSGVAYRSIKDTHRAYLELNRAKDAAIIKHLTELVG